MPTLVETENCDAHKSDDVLIHIRYFANGKVMFIDWRPAQLTGQEWRDLLLRAAPEHYRTFAGARGFFRLPSGIYNSLLATLTPMAAE